MASIRERNGSFVVIYYYKDSDGRRHQKWETFPTKPQAVKRKREIEYRQEMGVFTVPMCKTVKNLMDEYVPLYGKERWAISHYTKNMSLINNYIIPLIGDTKLSDVNARFLEKFYRRMSQMPGHINPISKKGNEHISPSTIRDIHKLLRSAFQQAVKWELLERNPAANATTPKCKKKEREIWTAETVMSALEVCDNKKLKLAISLAFSCSLRLGELLGITWNCVDISDEAISTNSAFIFIDKEVQRVDKKALVELGGKDVLLVFPEKSKNNKTVLVLKVPKTESSIRKVFLPKTVAYQLIEWKKEQEKLKDIMGSEYADYNLVMTTSYGLPIGDGAIRNSFKKLIKEHNFPPVVFHSLRHTSITYKLKLNGGDIKAVQGDSGHSQINMVTDVYSHIIDDDRKRNAEMFEDAFYSKKNLNPQFRKNEEDQITMSVPEGLNADLLEKILSNPEMVALLTSLAKTIA